MDNLIKDYLSTHPLFSDEAILESESIHSLSMRQFCKGDAVYRPGEKATHAYLIVDGSIKFEIATSGGQNIYVDKIGKNFMFGELALLTGFDYQSSAIANELTKLIILPKEILLSLIATQPEFALRFTKQLATNFFFFQAVSADKEASSLKNRLANTIMSLGLRFGEKNNDIIQLKVSHNELSEMLNASRQHISLQLKEWQQAGIIESRYGTITIKDIENLSQFSGLMNSFISEHNIEPFQ